MRTSTPGGAGGGEDTDDDVAWVPYGPAEPGAPGPQPQYYGGLFERSCQSIYDNLLGADPREVSPTFNALYGGAAAACLALADNDAAYWRAAETQLGVVGSPAGLDCMDTAVHRLLRSLVAAHRARPDTAPTVRPARSKQACPWSVTTILPRSGPVGTATEILIRGQRLWGVTAVRVGGRVVPTTQESTEYVAVRVPADLPPGPVSVTIEQGPAGSVTVAAGYTYLPVPTGSTLPVPTGSTLPVPTGSADTGTPTGAPSS